MKRCTGVVVLTILACFAAAERPAADEVLEVNVDRVTANGKCIYFTVGDFDPRLGDLTATGEKQVIERFDLITNPGSGSAVLTSQRQIFYALKEEPILYVAPTRSAMATALIICIRLWHDLATYEDREMARMSEPDTYAEELHLMPKVEFQMGLTDTKVERLERLTDNDNALEKYLRSIVERYGNDYFEATEKWVADKMFEKMKATYGDYWSRTGGTGGVIVVQGSKSSDEYSSALDLYLMANRVKTSMATLSDGQPLLMVGTAKLSAYLFMPLLSSMNDNKDATMQAMTRDVTPLGPASALVAQWKKSSPLPYFAAVLEYATAGDGLPVFGPRVVVPFDDEYNCKKEVAAGGVLPAKAEWFVGVMHKIKKRKYLPDHSPKTRLIYVAWEPQGTGRQRTLRQGYVMWLTPDAQERKGIVNVNDDLLVQLSTSLDPQQDGFVTLKSSRGEWILNGGKAVNSAFVNAVWRAKGQTVLPTQ